MTLLFWFCDAHGAVCLTKMPPIGIKNFVFLDALEGKYAFICPCSSTFFLLLTLSLFSFLQQDMGIIKRTVHFSKVLMLLARRMTSMTGTWHCLRSVTLTFQYLYQMIDWNQTHRFNVFPLSSFRKSWTSGPRFPRCLTAWSTTPASPKEPRSMRRKKALRPHAERPPRSGVRAQ